jgi:hypothetical protein
MAAEQLLGLQGATLDGIFQLEVHLLRINFGFTHFSPSSFIGVDASFFIGCVVFDCALEKNLLILQYERSS